MSRPIEYLDLDDVLALADRLLGVRLAVRDVGLLGSAVARPQTTVGGSDAYPDIWTKAAALLQSIVNNHALVDGNKSLLAAGVRATEGSGQQDLVGRRVLSAGRRRPHLREDVLEHPLQQGSPQCRSRASRGAGAQERIHRGNLPADVDGHRAGSLSLAVALPPSGVVRAGLR